MFKRIFISLLLFIVTIGASWAYNNTYAIIIGVADYKFFGPHDGDLECSVRDATSFRSFLMSKKGGSVPASNIVLLTDSRASKANIIAKGKALFAKAKKDDRVILFFAGHGIKGCFVPYDVSKTGGNLLYFDEVKSIFQCAQCNNKLLFADACEAGSMKKGLTKNPKRKRSMEKGLRAASNMNIAVMMSCQGDEYSYEDPNLGNGVFTYYLMEGLSGKANSDGNKYITIQELFYYVYRKVQNRNRSQTPELFGDFDLKLIVANL